MSNFNNIQHKLEKFIKKYYKNELMKGIILFVSFGMLYLIFTLLVEHFLWLKPNSRTILFYLFILVELGFFIKYIFVPILKLIGLKKGISKIEASKIIGNHFKEVDDKLINVLQLNENKAKSELLLASIDQKSKGLKPIPFKNAINFKNNTKYLKYAIIPILFWAFTFLTGNNSNFKNSFKRVVNHNLAYEPPAPFKFIVENENLNSIEGKPFKLNIKTVGKVIPEDAKIYFLNENHLLYNKGQGNFEYLFPSIIQSTSFYIEANGFASKTYRINLINTPKINGLEMQVYYPSYTNNRNQTIKNTGNLTVPQGTKINWNISTQNTDSVHFKDLGLNIKEVFLQQKEESLFKFSKNIKNTVNYQISTSNKSLKNYENLEFSIQVIRDENPTISVSSNIDSITRGPAQFIGQLSDDYGLNKLQLVYYDKNDLVKNTFPIKINNSIFEEFYYLFPDGLNLKDGTDYEMYFEVFDNDAVNGNKRAKSKVFSYRKQTESELKEELLKEQKNTLEDLYKTIEKAKDNKKNFEDLEKQFQDKNNLNWNDKSKLNQYIKRQSQYEQMMQQQTDKLLQNLDDQPKTENDQLNQNKEDIKKRIEEVKEIAKQEKLLEELKDLAEKLNKEDLLDKLKKLSKQNKQKERSLERLLELTKRFYVEQKLNQIQQKLDSLAGKQDKASDLKNQNTEEQKELNKEFQEIQKETKELENQNQKLKKPMPIPDMETDEQDIKNDMDKALDKLQKEESEKAQQKQKSASKKMKQLSKQLQKTSQQMQGESSKEDIESLRMILENLIEFSFKQEDLLDKFSSIDVNHPEYSQSLKDQHILKEYFEHIDDSLYTLSMRLPKLSSKIDKDLSDTHFYLDEALAHFSDNIFSQGVSDQQFVMTASNNLAYLLSRLLDNLQNPSSGSGSGSGGEEFALPDIIKKQGENIEQMKEGMQNKEGGKEGKEGKDGKEGENGENSNGELYEIYKQQAEMRQQLEELLNKNGKGKDGQGQDVVKEMEELERELLEKGLTKQVLNKMMQLQHELLKLDKAMLQQGEDDKRKSNSNTEKFDSKLIEELKLQNKYFNQSEILNRQSLPLRTIYKKKVQEYFKHD